jgi:segregation and condensation protein B
VNSASSLRTLLDKKLITTAGRKEVVGTPFLYKTTKEFLIHFGLTDLKDLPRPEDLDALYGVETNTAQTELFPEEDPAEEKNEEKEVGKEEEGDSSNGR